MYMNSKIQNVKFMWITTHKALKRPKKTTERLFQDKPAVRSCDVCHTHLCVKHRKTGRVAATQDKEALFDVSLVYL